ncbi:MAG: alpha/beta fold hydrolase [Desulfuromonadales bacterium]|uniref:alpha/beta fold hydrolase n=1 Tax=Desulfuromonas sp. KJ2020 TaxID=2919173 RepID=UPI0020A72ABD|nr:hypothetical protein [Desulfuromonas sp. KJ2020]MCP3177868.1 hypothetical protein [Desulfuromonas sp. KJ2020]
MKAVINGKKISYCVEGQGKAVVLLGGEAQPIAKEGFLAQSGYRVIVPDLSASDETKGSSLAGKVVALMNYLGTGRAVVAANRLNADLVKALEERYPQRLADVVFLDGSPEENTSKLIERLHLLRQTRQPTSRLSRVA